MTGQLCGGLLVLLCNVVQMLRVCSHWHVSYAQGNVGLHVKLKPDHYYVFPLDGIWQMQKYLHKSRSWDWKLSALDAGANPCLNKALSLVQGVKKTCTTLLPYQFYTVIYSPRVRLCLMRPRAMSHLALRYPEHRAGPVWDLNNGWSCGKLEQTDEVRVVCGVKQWP